MKIRLLAVGMAVLLPMLAACSGSSGPAYYVYAGGTGQSRGILLIAWSAPQDSQVQGTITYDTVDTSDAPQESLAVNSAPFTGMINGSSVVLTTSGLLGGTTINGTLGDGTLTITTPPDSSTGTIHSATLTAASTSTYNSDLASLRASISRANVLAAQEQAQQQQQQQDSAPPKGTWPRCGTTPALTEPARRPADPRLRRHNHRR